MINSIEKYFPEITTEQRIQFSELGDLYTDWNSKINLISRKDIENLYERHILHSLGIAQVIRFKDKSEIMDVGTGGGFPGIPLAILFPEVTFYLIDSIGKKVKVAQEIASHIGLRNIQCTHGRVEEEKRKVDFVVSRAVMPLPDLVKASKKNIKQEQKNGLPNGFLCLKGGDLQQELKPYKKIVTVYELTDYFTEPFFETKKVVYLPA